MSVTLQLERLAVDLVQEGAPKLGRAAGLVDDGLGKRVLAGDVELVALRELLEELQVGDAVGFGQVDGRFCKDQIPNPILRKGLRTRQEGTGVERRVAWFG